MNITKEVHGGQHPRVKTQLHNAQSNLGKENFPRSVLGSQRLLGAMTKVLLGHSGRAHLDCFCLKRNQGDSLAPRGTAGVLSPRAF